MINHKRIRYIAEAGIIAALYVVLCVIFAPISYGEIQVRIAEALTILPIFTPAAIPGLVIGCLFANILGGGIVLDVIVGTLATLIGAVGTYYLRNKTRWVAPLPPIIANTILVPFVLYYGYGIKNFIPLMMASVGIGEIIGAGVLGLILAFAIDKLPKKLFRKDSK